jgi:hypothetical protein
VGLAGLAGLPGVIAMLEGVGIAGRSARAACRGCLVRSGWQRGLMGLVVHREVSFPGELPEHAASNTIERIFYFVKRQFYEDSRQSAAKDKT